MHVDEGLLMCHGHIKHCRCLLRQFKVSSRSTQEVVAEPFGEIKESDEANISL
jgi:hypothetical protein